MEGEDRSEKDVVGADDVGDAGIAGLRSPMQKGKTYTHNRRCEHGEMSLTGGAARKYRATNRMTFFSFAWAEALVGKQSLRGEMREARRRQLRCKLVGWTDELMGATWST